VAWIDTELVLVTVAAMLSPTTLTFSTLVLVLSDRPFRTGCWFYVGAVGATLAIGILAAFVLGDAAASSHPSTPKTWVAIVDVVAAVVVLAWVSRTMRRPRNAARTAAAMEQMRKVTASPAVAIVAAGATLANPGGFIPLALKEISELDPSRGGYAIDWLFFTFVSLLPLATALLLLLVAREWTGRVLESARGWLELHARTVAAVLLVLVSLALLRNGIAGLTA
jgi:Sap, sulfolipid-1-addressing protein